MRPVTLPDEVIPEDMQAIVVKPAAGDEGKVAPCPAYLRNVDGQVVYYVMIELDKIDIAQLKRQQSFWLKFHDTQMPPWSVEHVTRTSDLGSVLCMACGQPTEPNKLAMDEQGRLGHRSCLGAGLRPVPNQEVEECRDNNGSPEPTS